MDGAVAVGAEAVVARIEIVAERRLHFAEHRGKGPVFFAVALEVEDRVHALAGTDVVEGKEPVRQIKQDRQKIALRSGDDPKPELVVDGGGDRVLLRE